MEVSDEGRGINQETQSRFASGESAGGLRGMKERAKQFDGLPAPLAVRGRRLVYTVGIMLLFLLCGLLLVAFGGVTDGSGAKAAR